jgi:stage II sporulation protein D
MLRLGFIILGIMVVVPVFAVLFLRYKSVPEEIAKPNITENYSESNIYSNIETYTVPSEVRLKSGEKIETIPMKDYIIGVLFAEIPAYFPTEAIKAQAASVYTYTIRETVKHKASDFDVSEASYMNYFTEGMARAFYTNGYNDAYRKFSEAADAVIGTVIVFDNEPIAASYFSCYTGKTETVENIPYLRAVESPGDISSPVYQTTEKFTAAELRARLSTEAGITLDGAPEEYLEIKETSPSGTVLKLRAGDSEISGEEFAYILNLKSPAFNIFYDNNTERINITTRGEGNGVGMSKYGAKAMAEDGSSWEEIVLHYYTGVKLVSVNFN